MKPLDIIYWITIVIMWASILYGVYFRKKTKTMIKTNYQDFAERYRKEYSDFVEHHSERLNLLSKENSKLREQNEELKERLRGLGITDFDVI